MRKSVSVAAVLGAAALVLSGCALTQSGQGSDSSGSSEGPLKGVKATVGGKEFTEQLILCQIIAMRLADNGADVTKQCGVHGSSSVRSAELSGDIDLYYDYTGTGWITYLKQTKSVPDSHQLWQKVHDMDLKQNHIVWLPPAKANNSYAIGVEKSTGKELGVSTLSDFANLANTDPAKATFCSQVEFAGRDDGWPGLSKTYGINLPKQYYATLEEGAIPNAISKGNPCNFGVITTTDGRIPALGLAVLKDDKHFFPYYNLSLTAREKFLDENPKVKDVMKPVTDLLTTKTLQDLNGQVDVDGKSPKKVASAWLEKNDLD